MKKYSILFTISIISLLWIGCKKDAVEPETTTLDGTWIEAKDRQDTVVINSELSFFTLKRGKEMQNGHLLPKPYSSIYKYEIKNNSILLYNMLSSLYAFTAYGFAIENGKLKIDDFYQKNTQQSEKLTFVKLK